MELASGTNPALRESLLDLARTWARLATDLEATKRLLDAWDLEEPSESSVSD
jgi:hypothetical protein